MVHGAQVPEDTPKFVLQAVQTVTPFDTEHVLQFEITVEHDEQESLLTEG